MHTMHAPQLVHSLLQVEGTAKIMHILDHKGECARFVGGSVRDVLLKKKITDIDIATSLLPEESIALLVSHGIKVLPTGIKHGTITAFFKGNAFEITTLRRDVECNGRRAIVAFTDDWQLDAARRDFTMNALSCSIEGIVYDYFGGIKDLQQGIIRFVGNPSKRIEEDFLRILRFFRFSAYYAKGEIEAGALNACTLHAPSLLTLSAERIQSEMLKILLAPACVDVLAIMQTHHILSVILPCTVDFSSLQKLLAVEKITHSRPNALRRLAVMLRTVIPEVDKRPVVSAITVGWKLSLQQRKLLEMLVSPLVDISISLDVAGQKKAIRLLGKSLFHELTLLAWAEAEAVFIPNAANYFSPMIQLAEYWEVPAFPVTGKDLLEYGMIKGKQLGSTLKMLETQWEESGYNATKKELLHSLSAFIRGGV